MNSDDRDNLAVSSFDALLIMTYLIALGLRSRHLHVTQMLRLKGGVRHTKNCLNKTRRCGVLIKKRSTHPLSL
jgi:hypothetical protein